MTFTADTYGEDFLESGELDLYEEDPENPCNIRSECALGMKEIYSNLVKSGWNLRASPMFACFAFCRWGQEENCYSRAGVDIVKPLQGANLKTEGSFSFRSIILY